MANFLDAIDANPVPSIKRHDSFATKMVKNIADTAIDRSILAPLLGTPIAPLAGTALVGESFLKTMVDPGPQTFTPGWGGIPGLDVKASKIHTPTKITPGPGQMTQDQKNLQELMKVAAQQQQQIKQMGTDLGNVIQDLYGDGPTDSANNYDTGV
jgi:hypothetical protein